MEAFRFLEIKRKEKKISQAYLAKELGVTRQTVYNIESGTTDLSLKQYCQICTILGISPIEFFNSDDNSNSFSISNDDLKKVVNAVSDLNNIFLKNDTMH